MDCNVLLVFAFAEVMGKKGGRDWFQLSRAANKGEGASNVPVSPFTIPFRPVGVGAVSRSSILCVDDTLPSSEQVLTQKRKVSRVKGTSDASRKGKTSMTEPTEPEEERSLPLGMWDPGFDLRHKIEFHFDAAEEKVGVAMSEQEMSDFLLDNLLRGAAAAFKMAYAFVRGNLREEVERLKKQLEDANVAHAGCDEKAVEAAKVIADSQLSLENSKRISEEVKNERDRLSSDLEAAKKTIADLTVERDDLQQTLEESKETQAEMLEAIGLEHTKGFKKALRQMEYLAKVSPEGLGFDIEQDIYLG